MNSNSIRKSDSGYIINLSVISTKEDDLYVAYSPALELAGQGNSQEAAEQSLSYVIKDFFEYTLKNNTLQSNLLILGWKYDEGECPGDIEDTSSFVNEKIKLDGIDEGFLTDFHRDFELA